MNLYIPNSVEYCEYQKKNGDNRTYMQYLLDMWYARKARQRL